MNQQIQLKHRWAIQLFQKSRGVTSLVFSSSRSYSRIRNLARCVMKGSSGVGTECSEHVMLR